MKTARGVQIPKHLEKFVVDQQNKIYTNIDQAVWRYIMRRLTKHLSKTAHQCYLKGLKKIGISTEKIPLISDIDKNLKKFGWSAVPVSGFIPPAAFLEFQSLGILPIASDMRSIEHLDYTPAPDIVHESSGHAPILIDRDFSRYLHRYAHASRNAIFSKEDLDLYKAIRILSDLKEDPRSTKKQIEEAEESLNQVTKNISYISEAAELARMNWWTAEYGLIGSLENPKIYGAGLLSSVGESEECLKPKVKKIPLTVDCVNYAYDITEMQPQLFVTPDFAHLVKVFEEFEASMAFKKGGVESLEKIKKSRTINTIELDSGIQVSGKLKDYFLDRRGEVSYVRFEGPSQVSIKRKQIKGHGPDYHAHGFGTPMGKLKSGSFEDYSVGRVRLDFESGVTVEGDLKNIFKNKNKILIMSFENCKVSLEDQVLFDPSWGTFDMVLGSKVISVFGGPADEEAFENKESFLVKRVEVPSLEGSKKILDEFLKQVRFLREQKIKKNELEFYLEQILGASQEQGVDNWLLNLEIFELAQKNKLENLSKYLEITFEQWKDQAVQEKINFAKALIKEELS